VLLETWNNTDVLSLIVEIFEGLQVRAESSLVDTHHELHVDVVTSHPFIKATFNLQGLSKHVNLYAGNKTYRSCDDRNRDQGDSVVRELGAEYTLVILVFEIHLVEDSLEDRVKKQPSPCLGILGWMMRLVGANERKQTDLVHEGKLVQQMLRLVVIVLLVVVSSKAIIHFNKWLCQGFQLPPNL
jgi:hypothetical protein